MVTEGDTLAKIERFKQSSDKLIRKGGKKVTEWRRRYIIWWSIHYLTGIVGVLAGVLAGSLGNMPALRQTMSPSGIASDFMKALPSASRLTTHSLELGNKAIDGNWDRSVSTIYLGALAGICTSLVTFLGAQHKAVAFTNAYHKLEHALDLYESGEIDTKKYLEISKHCRQIVQYGNTISERKDDD